MTNAETIWKRLKTFGLTDAGCAGLMGNLQAESGLKSVCLDNLYKKRDSTYTDATYAQAVDRGTISRAEFINPLGRRYGWGLAQWTFPEQRKAKLYDLSRKRGVSIGNLDLQLDYLYIELTESYPEVLNVLMTTQDVQAASDVVLLKYEMPDNAYNMRKARAEMALHFFTQYAGIVEGSNDMAVTAENILNVMRGWVGRKESDGTWWPIVTLYNNYISSHPSQGRGYKLSKSDSWCDATVSAAFIKLNAVSLIGKVECGVQEHIGVFKSAGIWKGKIKPQAGDIICYDWGKDGCSDHIGIVESISGDTVTTIEGNYSDAVKRRKIAYNHAQISGYARPKYASVPAAAAAWAKQIAADNSHGYDNSAAGRKGNPDYACSSFVTAAFIAAGVNLPTAGSVYTADMVKIFTARGFTDVTKKITLASGAGLQVGDIVLRPGQHVEIVVAAGKLAGARGNAQSLKAENGKAGDQTGQEIAVSAYYNFPWTKVLRWTKSVAAASQQEEIKVAEVKGTCYTQSLKWFLQGAQDPQVKLIQIILNSRGYGLVVDGDLGAKTAAAITKEQQKAGMKDINYGTVAEKTWHLLLGF